MRKHPRFATFVVLPCLALGTLSPVLVHEAAASGSTAKAHHHRHHAPRTSAQRRRLLHHLVALHRRQAIARQRAARAVHLVAVDDPGAHSAPPTPSAGGVWHQLRLCESGGDYAANTGNGYYGAYQFALGTWESLGGTGLPSAAPAVVQDALAARLQARSGWWSWPHCAYSLGLL